jgi:hypothetical protein
LNEPAGNTNVPAGVPERATPPAVNTPVAMTLAVLEVPDVLMSRKCSVPETADRPGDAPAGTASHRAAATAATVTVAKEMMRFNCFSLPSSVNSPRREVR